MNFKQIIIQREKIIYKENKNLSLKEQKAKEQYLKSIIENINHKKS